MRRAWKERPVSTLLATGLGIGMIPLAPGTWGSVEGLAIAALLARAAPAGGDSGAVLVLAGAVLVLIAGTAASGRAEAVSEARDPGSIVVDEIAGQMIACTPCVLLGVERLWLWVISFLLFRLFDIWKPGPIRKLQDFPGGWGIMADDVAAGIAAGAITFAIGALWR